MSDLFLNACRGLQVERVPVWIMRQAGPYLPEYRAVRERVDFGTLLKTPDLATRVSLQPLARFRVDAAVLVSDLLAPAESLGFRVSYSPSPKIAEPVRDKADVARIRIGDPEEEMPFVYDTIRNLRTGLGDRVPLIGIGPAPFTLAASLVEGKSSIESGRVKQMLYSDPETAHELLEKCISFLEMYLAAQVLAGAQALQICDPCAGVLSLAEYREFALRYTRRLMETLRREGAPLIYFVPDACHLHEGIRDCSADVVSLDWRMDLAEASERLDQRFVLQGNLDPRVLFAPPGVIAEKLSEVLDQGAEAPGHILNLGQDILPDTPIENVRMMVETVRRHEVRVTW